MIVNGLSVCSCKCHFGGAVSCPSCKEKHDKKMHCEFCSKKLVLS